MPDNKVGVIDKKSVVEKRAVKLKDPVESIKNKERVARKPTHSYSVRTTEPSLGSLANITAVSTNANIVLAARSQSSKRTAVKAASGMKKLSRQILDSLRRRLRDRRSKRQGLSEPVKATDRATILRSKSNEKDRAFMLRQAQLASFWRLLLWVMPVMLAASLAAMQVIAPARGGYLSVMWISVMVLITSVRRLAQAFRCAEDSEEDSVDPMPSSVLQVSHEEIKRPISSSEEAVEHYLTHDRHK